MKRVLVTIELDLLNKTLGEWVYRVSRNGKPLHKHRGFLQLPALGEVVMLHLHPLGEDLSTLKGYEETLPRTRKKVETLVSAVRSLLEWMPTCSPGSSGYKRREAVEKAIADLEGK